MSAAGHEMRDVVARALCPAVDEPCRFHTTDADIAVIALAEAGHLRIAAASPSDDQGAEHPGVSWVREDDDSQTDDGAASPPAAPVGTPVRAGGDTAAESATLKAAPSSPYGPEPSRDCLIVDRDYDIYRWEERAWVCLTESNYGTWAELQRYGPMRVYALQTGGGAGDTPPATSAAPLDPAAQAGEAIGSPTPPPPRLFELYRHSDITGLTGTGVVAWGAQWPDGTASLRWPEPLSSTVAWANVERIIAVHGHQGSTELRWLDGGE